MTLSPGIRIGHYRVVKFLGKGGMGQVHVGHDEKLDRMVALKSLHADHRPLPGIRERFLREARVLSQLAHPNICQIFDYLQEDEEDLLVLELIEGRNLNEVMKQDLDFQARLVIAEQIAAALVAAHEKGIIHRDLKPENVMLTDRGQVKVLDFGLSRLLQDDLEGLETLGPQRALPAPSDPGDSGQVTLGFGSGAGEATMGGGSSRPSGRLTTVGMIMGTPFYMSPEQARGEEASTASDLYSFGLLLHELFTGQPPYPKQTPLADLVKMVGEGKAAPVEGLDAGLTHLIQRLKSLAPASRPSAVDAAERLAWIGLRPKRRRRKALLAASLVILALFGAAMTVQSIRATRAERSARIEAETSRQVSDFLEGLFRVSDPGQAKGSSVTARELLDKGAERISRDLSGQPAVQARLMDTMGKVYWRLGLGQQARDLVQKALVAHERRGAGEDPEFARSLNLLANIQCDLGQFALAEPLFQRSLKIVERTLPPGHKDLGTVLNSIGNLYLDQGRYPDAEPVFKRSIGVWEKVLGADHPDVAAALNNLAILYFHQGRFAEAEPLYRRALRIRENALGPDHPDVAQACMNLGILLDESNKLEEAGPLLVRSLAIREKVLGPDHRGVATSLSNLANHWVRVGRFAEAEPLYLRGVAILEKSLGPAHPALAQGLLDYACACLKQKRFNDGESAMRRALGIWERALGPNHPSVGGCLYSLACLKAQQGNRPEALGLLRRALPMAKGVAWTRTLAQDDDLAPLRGDPGFEQLAAEGRQGR